MLAQVAIMTIIPPPMISQMYKEIASFGTRTRCCNFTTTSLSSLSLLSPREAAVDVSRLLKFLA